MTTLYSEIREQPDRILDLLESHGELAEFGKDFRKGGIDSLTLAARGTSRNAALYGIYLFGARNRLPIHLINFGLQSFLDELPLAPDTAVAGISQSGSSSDLCAAMQRAQDQGHLTWAITNKVHGRMSQYADRVLDIRAGPEKSTAATKSYVNQLVALGMLSDELAGKEGVSPEFRALPGVVRRVLASEEQISQLAEKLVGIESLLIAGRGYNHPLASETALKLQEVCYVRAMPFTSADFLHGPIALLEEGSYALCVDSGRKSNPQFRDIQERTRQAGSRLLAAAHGPEGWPEGTQILELPPADLLPDHLWPIPAMVALQLLVMHIGLAKGLDVSHPRYLQKETSTA